MIKTRHELKFYLAEDAKQNKVSKLKYLPWLFCKRDVARVYRWLKAYRKCEYHYNNRSNPFHKLLYYFFYVKKERLGNEYGISASINRIGYGLRICHLAPSGVRLGVSRAGNYCTFNAGVLLGTKNSQARPELGDHVTMAPGSIAYGGINIGDNVLVAANAVVTKDVPANCIVAGIPAKIIKHRELE